MVRSFLPSANLPVSKTERIPVSVLIPTRNEANNLPRCLESLGDFEEIWIVDSGSTDGTTDVAVRAGARIVHFDYKGGWPKKRQWALDNLTLRCDWILLLDADEILTAELVAEIREAVKRPQCAGYYIALRTAFLGRTLRYGDTRLWKLALFRKGKGRFEQRLAHQDASMGDIEVHEHVLVDGRTENLREHIVHRNLNSIARYIEKHNEYSNWEARVLVQPPQQTPLLGKQAHRRRALKRLAYRIPGSPLLLFFYRYLFRLGFLDGPQGLIYCSFQAIQLFHTKAKILEARTASRDKRGTSTT